MVSSARRNSGFYLSDDADTNNELSRRVCVSMDRPLEEVIFEPVKCVNDSSRTTFTSNDSSRQSSTHQHAHGVPFDSIPEHISVTSTMSGGRDICDQKSALPTKNKSWESQHSSPAELPDRRSPHEPVDTYYTLDFIEPLSGGNFNLDTSAIDALSRMEAGMGPEQAMSETPRGRVALSCPTSSQIRSASLQSGAVSENPCNTPPVIPISKPDADIVTMGSNEWGAGGSIGADHISQTSWQTDPDIFEISSPERKSIKFDITNLDASSLSSLRAGCFRVQPPGHDGTIKSKELKAATSTRKNGDSIRSNFRTANNVQSQDLDLVDTLENASKSAMSIASGRTKSGSSMRNASAIVNFYVCGNWHLSSAALASERYTVWLEYLYYTLLALLIQVILGWGHAFPDGRPACNYENSSGTSTTNVLICDLAEVLEYGQQQMRILVAFILGGFITNVIYLWKLRRTNYCALCGVARNLIIQIATLISTSNDADMAMETRKKMVTWVVLGFELSILKARGKVDTEEGRKYLMNLNLVDFDEWQNMVEGDRHTTVWYWIQQHAVDLCNDGTISSELRLQTICEAVTLIRDKANDLMSCIDRDQPIAYTFVVGLLVNLNLLLMSLSKGVQWAIWFYDTRGMVWCTPKMYADLFLALTYTSVFAMLYDISRVLYNPFGFREDLDIPHEIVGGGIRNLAKRFGHAQNCRPKRLRDPGRQSTRTTRSFYKSESMLNVANMEENIAFEAQQVLGQRRKYGPLSIIYGGGQRIKES